MLFGLRIDMKKKKCTSCGANSWAVPTSPTSVISRGTVTVICNSCYAKINFTLSETNLVETDILYKKEEEKPKPKPKPKPKQNLKKDLDINDDVFKMLEEQAKLAKIKLKDVISWHINYSVRSTRQSLLKEELIGYLTGTNREII